MATINKKQRMLVEAYYQSGSVSHAGSVAGYKNMQSAWGVLHKPAVWSVYQGLVEAAETDDQLNTLDNEARRGNPGRGWIVRRLVHTALDKDTKPGDQVRALALLADITGVTKQPVQKTLQPVVIKSTKGSDLFEFGQAESPDEFEYAVD